MGSGRFFVFKTFARDFIPPKPSYLPTDYPDLTGKVAIVTGANTGIGLAAAKLLASKNCYVIVSVRSEAKGEATIKAITEALGENEGKPIGKVDYVTFDLSDLSTIKSGADQVLEKSDKLNIIIHNAGIMTPPAELKTAQKHDAQFGTNAIGPFLLQKYLDPLFLKPNTTFKRLVWLSSAAHVMAPPNGGIQWDDINFEKTHDMNVAYGQSKAANNILAGVWPQHHASEVASQNIVSVAVHPGYIGTDLMRHLSRWAQIVFGSFLHDSKYGAYSELFGALSPTLTSKENGTYIVPWGVVGEPRDDVRESITNGNGEKLWSYLEDVTKSF